MWWEGGNRLADVVGGNRVGAWGERSGGGMGLVGYGGGMVSGWEPATDGDFFLFSSRLSDIEVKISFDLEVCFLVMLVGKQSMHAISSSIHLDQFLWLTRS